MPKHFKGLLVLVVVISLVIALIVNTKDDTYNKRATYVKSKPIVDVKPTNAVSELSTLCSATEQFGLLVTHCAVVKDETVELANFKFEVNNSAKLCHVMKNTQSYFLEGYYDTVTSDGIFSIGFGSTRSVWTAFDTQLYSTPLGIFTKDVTDLETRLNYADSILANAGDYYNGQMTKSALGTYYTNSTEVLHNLPTFLPESVVKPKASKTTVFLPDTDCMQSYRIRYIIFYEDNTYGVSAEYYDFEVLLDVRYEEEIPVDADEITTNLETYEYLYKNITR